MKVVKDIAAAFLMVLIGVVLLCGVIRLNNAAVEQQRRDPYGNNLPTARPHPDSYAPYPLSRKEIDERNMSQSGLNDVQIPLNTRQDYAREHGLPLPIR